jgi:hypothetical protein
MRRKDGRGGEPFLAENGGRRPRLQLRRAAAVLAVSRRGRHRKVATRGLEGGDGVLVDAGRNVEGGVGAEEGRRLEGHRAVLVLCGGNSSASLRSAGEDERVDVQA